jgi:hypothetical protein
MAIGFFLFLPLFFSWLFSPFGEDIASPSKPGWLGAGLAVASIVVILYTVLPFIIERTFMGVAAARVRARGKDPRVVVLTCALASSGTPCFVGFVLGIYGAPTFVVYVSSCITVTSVLFWVWRYRDVLLGSGSAG